MSKKHFMYGVICANEVAYCAPENSGIVELPEKEYLRQLNNPDATWRCPRCRAEAIWDDGSKVCN